MAEPAARNIRRQWDDGRMQPSVTDTLQWAEVREALAASQSYWVATLSRKQGAAPHVRPVLGVVLDDAWWSTSSPQAVKHRNLVRSPGVSVLTTVPGLDVVLEGVAETVGDERAVAEVARTYREKYGWPVEPDGADPTCLTAPYGAPAAGPPPYLPYRVRPVRVYAFGTDEEHAARSTRFGFG